MNEFKELANSAAEILEFILVFLMIAWFCIKASFWIVADIMKSYRKHFVEKDDVSKEIESKEEIV